SRGCLVLGQRHRAGQRDRRGAPQKRAPRRAPANEVSPRKSWHNRAMANVMRERVAALEAERARILQMGGPDKVAKQHERKKLTARERLAQFFDGGSFFEIGLHGTQMGQS